MSWKIHNLKMQNISFFVSQGQNVYINSVAMNVMSGSFFLKIHAL